MKNTDGTVGVQTVNDDELITARTVDGGVVISAGSATEVRVYDVTGRAVAVVNVEEVAFVPLAQGVYIVADKKVVVL